MNGAIRNKSLRTISTKIMKLYSKDFNTQETHPTKTKAVYPFTTLYISMYDSSTKVVKYIIATVTFGREKKKNFTSIGWEFVKY